MTRAVATVGVLLLVLAVWTMMYRGWQGRVRRQQDVPAPAPIPAALAERAAVEGVEVVYVSTTTASDWLDRLAVHGLGVRCDARLLVDPAGVAVLRSGQPELFVPAADLRAVRRETMRAGKALPGPGLLVWDWVLGSAVVSTAVHGRRDAETAVVEASLRALTSGSGHGDPAPGPS